MLPVNPESLLGLVPLLYNPSLNFLDEVGSFTSAGIEKCAERLRAA